MFGRATITLGIGPHYSFNCDVETEGLINVTKSGNILELEIVGQCPT